jgi:EAL domain-containing protein (putative c-di-GMP-specific phosphodiesterase class I)
VLLRLREGDQKLIPPMAFLPAAERYSLMPQIDRWVIARAFEVVRQNKLLGQGGYVSINLSSISLMDNALVDFIAEQLRVSDISPRAICFEITELAAATQMEQASKLISALKSLGCRVALDNFSGGLGSFPYLRDHPVDYLKIDGQYIKDIANDDLSYAMVESINRMAHVLGIQTVAESVETASALDKLDAIGVDHVQGYAVHRPQPIGEVKR